MGKNNHFKQLISLLVLFTFLLSGCGVQNESTTNIGEEYTTGVFAMGTYMTLTAYGESSEEAFTISEVIGLAGFFHVNRVLS